MKLIDADAMIKQIDDRLEELNKEGFLNMNRDSNGFFDILIDHLKINSEIRTLKEFINQQPTIEAELARHICIVRCKECKHRPVKRDINGEDYGFNLISPNGGDERCPCLVDDGWYSWMPEDDFYCGYGERGGAKMEEGELNK